MVAPGQSSLLAIAIMYFCLAGAAIFSMFIPLIFIMGGSFLLFTSIVGVITIACTIAVIILLIFAGKRLERKLIFIAGFIILASLVLTFVLGILYTTLGIVFEHTMIDAGFDTPIAVGISYGLVVTLPSAVPSVLFAACLIKDASKNGLLIAIPIIALVLVATGIAYNFIQVWLIWLGISNFGIPFGAGTSVLWGVYFLLVRNSLRYTPTATSMGERAHYP